MYKKAVIGLIVLVLASGTPLFLQPVHGGCGGNCNAVDPNNPNISSNGERIFLTGISKEGDALAAVKFRLGFPDDFFEGGAEHKKKIESGAMPCLRCHNFLGTGGIPFEFDGRTVKSANLVQIGEMKFSIDDLRKAVSQGVGMDKRKLVPFMPRFDFTEKQLQDIKGFIEELPKRLSMLQAEQEKQGKNMAF